ncbi:hypothetical protein N0V94_000411 [Neodidymelliopsis sp. IMI 364377]|nr:hypothetical protein N0V94_000411 [Neodidymelliopsis sp. IMI 364377]
MTPELVAHMRIQHYKALRRTLYGSTHGFGERKLKLNMTPGQSGFAVKIPVVCRYEDNVPTFFTLGVSKSSWMTLCKFVSGGRVLKVIFFDDAHDFLARVTLADTEPPKTDLVEVKFHWQEDDEMVLAWKKSIQWISEILE